MLRAGEFTVPVRDVFDASGRLTVAYAQFHFLVTFGLHLLRLIGIEPSQNSGHSFRICCATSVSISGLSDYGIKLIGRGNSDCYRRYTRPAPLP